MRFFVIRLLSELLTILVSGCHNNNIAKENMLLLGAVHTGMEVHGMTLTSAYVLHCLSATWLQL